MTRLTAKKKELMIEAAAKELRRSKAVIPLVLDLPMALVLVSQLQLALHHPANPRSASEMTQKIVDGIIARTEEEGLSATSKLMAAGNDPAFERRGWGAIN